MFFFLNYSETIGPTRYICTFFESRKFQLVDFWSSSDNNGIIQVSENLLSIYLDEYENTPWDALKYLIADVNYGGHVTDDCDRRLMQSYIYDYFTDEAIGKEYFKLSPLDTYVIPKVS